MISFFVPGIPVPQGSKRQVPLGGVHGGRSIMINANDKKLRPWRAELAGVASAEMVGKQPIGGPVVLELVFRFPRPSGHFGTGKNAGVVRASAPPAPGKKPDLDKLIRAVFDSLAGICFGDDAAVVRVVAEKAWQDRRGAGVEIAARPWSAGTVERRVVECLQLDLRAAERVLP